MLESATGRQGRLQVTILIFSMGPDRRISSMRAFGTLFFWLIAGYGALVLFVYVFQARLLYLPNLTGRELIATPAMIGLDYQDLRIQVGGGPTLHGWLVSSGRERAPVVLFFHGNAGNISHRLDSIRIFHELGLDVLIFDYRGYGQSEGRPSEEGTYRDAEAVWSYLTGEGGYSADRIVLFGRSLGAAVAAHLGQRVRPGALILESAFVSVPDLASYHYWYLPARLLSRFRYATGDYVVGVEAPVLVVHSPDDEIVPIAQGRRIFERAREPKEFLQIIGDHNGGFILSGSLYSDGLGDFLGRVNNINVGEQGTLAGAPGL